VEKLRKKSTGKFFHSLQAVANLGGTSKGGSNHMTLRNWVDMYWALSKRQEGQTMAEYGVILAVITVGVIAAIGFLAAAITGKLNNVTTTLGGVIH
jgi:Flp pilus assembly pilin Flp